MQLFGFVYIWYDKRDQRYYIGSHKGSMDDGYVCSSPKMKKEYKLRSKDFKRRILYYSFGDRIELLGMEQKWLDLIPRDQFGKKYYNLNADARGMLLATDEVRKESGRKGGLKRTGIKRAPRSKEWSNKISIALKGKKKLTPKSDETREKLRLANIGKVLTPEHRKKISDVVKLRFSNPEERRKVSVMKTGIKQSQETIEKRRIKLFGNKSTTGKIWVTNEFQNIMILKEDMIPYGFKRGITKLQKFTNIPDTFCLG